MDDSQAPPLLLSSSQPNIRSAHFWNSAKFRAWFQSAQTCFILLLLIVIGFLLFKKYTDDNSIKPLDITNIGKNNCIVKNVKRLQYSLIYYCFANDTGENIFIYNFHMKRELIMNNTLVIKIRHLLRNCFENEGCNQFYDIPEDVELPLKFIPLEYGKLFFTKKNVIKYLVFEPSENNLFTYYMFPDEILALYNMLVF